MCRTGLKRTSAGIFLFIYSSYFYKLACIKAVAEVFVMEDVAHLVGDDLCVAYDCIDVGVRMAVGPYVYAAVGNVVA